ncbi:MAG: acyl carrier protein [Methylococcales bacterium]
MSADNRTRTAIEIQDWLATHLAALLEIPPEELNPPVPFDRYGLDSATAVAPISDLEDWLETEIDPTLPYQYPTIRELADHVVNHPN